MRLKADTLRTFVRAAADVAAETLWPTRCCVCDAPGAVLCEKCERALLYIDACRACPRCGAPFGRVQCTECNDVMLHASDKETFPFTAMAHVLVLDDAARRMVCAWKDKDELRLTDWMALAMARYANPAWSADAVTYIPATAQARARRGFDHARLLAERLSTLLETDCIDAFCRPISSDQRRLSRTERLRNMESTLRIRDDASVPHSIVVIDDVCTTGATMYAAAEALRRAGAEEVWGLTLGRVMD